jgi:rhodanese-related sulfurtransferase
MIGKQISAEELYAIVNRKIPESLVVDVRTPAEFSKGAIAGAKNIPVDEIVAHKDLLAKYKNIYFYCFSGSRSQLAIAQLANMGLTDGMYSLVSGLLAWRKLGYPLI